MLYWAYHAHSWQNDVNRCKHVCTYTHANVVLLNKALTDCVFCSYAIKKKDEIERVAKANR